MKEFENRNATGDVRPTIHGHVRTGEISGRRIGRREMCSYYIAFEGMTECKYFDMIRSNKSAIGISSDIDIINLIRFEQESHKSGVYWNINAMKDYRELIKTGNYNVFLFVGDIMQQMYEYLYQQDMALIREFTSDSEQRKQLRKLFKERWNVRKKAMFNIQNVLADKLLDGGYTKHHTIIDLDEATEFCRTELSSREEFGEFTRFLRKPVAKKRDSFSDDYDIFCFVFDRDRNCGDRNTPEKYIKFIKMCDDNNISPYISNPSFELWIMMHLKDIDLDKEENLLLTNAKETRGNDTRNHAEWILEDHFEFGYQKDLKNTGIFTKNQCEPVRRAMDTATAYAQDEKSLEGHLGTNVNLLIERMRRNR